MGELLMRGALSSICIEFSGTVGRHRKLARRGAWVGVGVEAAKGAMAFERFAHHGHSFCRARAVAAPIARIEHLLSHSRLRLACLLFFFFPCFSFMFFFFFFSCFASVNLRMPSAASGWQLAHVCTSERRLTSIQIGPAKTY
ncbi:hypothetical protein BCR44DRAFT_212643 [Catenaria anguillulae PL171]|uniref:Uncharacterized protein n=1 Tax=Catenaria anguillulae PL171 TaxID=765915 RepID=A0A1Y2HME2_9FUNG|nr:hypothetical protein BCR44DRAFT_212643 [Catenaria anguillulae PL171]